MKKILLLLSCFVFIVCFSQDNKNKIVKSKITVLKQYRDSTKFEHIKEKDTLYVTVKKDSTLGKKCKVYSFSKKKPKK